MSSAKGYSYTHIKDRKPQTYKHMQTYQSCEELESEGRKMWADFSSALSERQSHTAWPPDTRPVPGDKPLPRGNHIGRRVHREPLDLQGNLLFQILPPMTQNPSWSVCMGWRDPLPLLKPWSQDRHCSRPHLHRLEQLVTQSFPSCWAWGSSTLDFHTGIPVPGGARPARWDTAHPQRSFWSRRGPTVDGGRTALLVSSSLTDRWTAALQRSWSASPAGSGEAAAQRSDCEGVCGNSHRAENVWYI